MITIANRWDGSPSEVPPSYIDLTISPDEGDLIVEINAPFHNNRRPPVASGRCPNLWEYEVVELFIGTTQATSFSTTPYLEFIVGPHGNWQIIGFTGEGKWDECDDSITLEQEPVVTIDPTTNRWNATISFPCSLMPEPECDPFIPLSLKWIVNAFAMFGDDPATRVCMACHPVPGDAPNFHQLKFFKPLTLFETDPNRHPSADIRQGPYPVVGADQLNASLLASHLKPSVTFSESGTSRMPSEPATSSRPRPRKSILEVAEMHRTPMPPSPPDASSAATSGSDGAALPTGVMAASENVGDETSSLLIEKYLRHLHEGEFVVLIGKVLKRKGWSYKKRILILSSKPRLLYINFDGAYRGSITWTMTSPLTVKKVSETQFDVTLFDGSRSYHFTDDNGADKWVTVIGDFLQAWKDYLDEQRGVTKATGLLKNMQV